MTARAIRHAVYEPIIRQRRRATRADGKECRVAVDKRAAPGWLRKDNWLGGSLTTETVSDESLTLRVYLPQASVAILTDDSESAAGPVAARI